MIPGPRRMAAREPQVLAVTADEGLADDVLRVAAAVGVAAVVQPTAGAAAAQWSIADLVVVDAARLGEVALLGLPKRSRVVVIADPPVPDGVWRQAMAAGISTVVTLPEGEAWLLEAFAEAGRRSASAAPVLTLIGSRGGVGASVLAAGVAAVAAKEGLDSYLLDLDPLGCGAPVLLGADELPGNGWADLATAVGRVPPRALRQGLPSVDGVKVISWLDQLGAQHPGRSMAGGATMRAPVAAPALGVAGSVLEAASRDADVVIVDLPRWYCLLPTAEGEGAQAIEVLSRSTQVAVVASADVRSALAARRLLRTTALQRLPVGVVVRGPSPGGLTAEDVAAALGIPLLAYVGVDRSLDRLLEEGLAPASGRRSPLQQAARALLALLADRSAEVRGVG